MHPLQRIEAERGRWLRFVRARVANAADAEDVVQRAMLRAVARAGTLEHAERAEAWFFRILRRAIADDRRATARDDAKRSDDVDVASHPATTAEPEHACKCGERLLSDLRPDYADVIRRVDVDDASVDEAARALRITTGNAHVRLHRARRALRERIETKCGVTTVSAALDCGCDYCD